MLIGTDILETIATLNNAGYLKGARQMAQATESLGNLNGWQKLARGSLIAGGAITAVAGDALKQAAAFQQLQKRLEILYGKPAGDSLFEQLKTLTFSEPFKLADLTKGVGLLAAYQVKAGDVLRVTQDLADASAAAFGSDTSHLQRGIMAFGELNSMTAGSRQLRMLTQDLGIPANKIVGQQLHLTEDQVADIGRLKIPGRVVAAAILRGIEVDPTRHGAGKKTMDTLGGAATNVADAWQILLASAGSPALAPAIAGMKHVADFLKYLGSNASPKALGAGLFIGGPALIIGGAAIRGWQQYTLAKNLAKVAQIGETAAEKAKLPVLAQEEGAVAAATTKWGAFGSMITRAGLWGVIIAGLAFDIGLVTKSINELGDASQRWEDAGKAAKAAQALGYDVKNTQMTGRHVDPKTMQMVGSNYAQLSHWKQYGELLANQLFSPFGFLTGDSLFNTDTSDLGTTPVIGPDWAKKHKGQGPVPGGIRDQQMKAAAAAAKAGGGGSTDPYQKIINDFLKGGGAEAAGGKTKKAKGWQLPKRYSEMVAADAAHVAALTAAHATQQKINAAKNKEIADMKTIAQLYKQQAALTKDANEKYRLLQLSDNEMTKASKLKASETKKRKSFNDIITTIISWQDSVQEPDAIQMGVSRRLFSSMSKGKAGTLSGYKSQGQMLNGLTASRPLHVHVHIGNKEISTLTKQISDEIIYDIVQMLTTSNMGSRLSQK